METLHSPESQIAVMPLHAITEMLGTDGLVQRFSYEVSRFSVEDQHKANQAFLVAYELHKDQHRTREPYINHVVRVATRIMSHYEVDDIDVICAALLHDSVEDHAKALAGDSIDDPKTAALATLSTWFNSRVARLVAGVTNPEFNRATKNEEYLAHISDLFLDGDPWLGVIKLSDFTDNATGLIYTVGPKVPKLARKYTPAVPVMRLALRSPDFPLAPHVIAHINEQLDLTEERLSLLAA